MEKQREKEGGEEERWRVGEGGGGRWVREEETEGKKCTEEERNRAREEGRRGGGISRVRRAKCASVVTSGIRGGAVQRYVYTCVRAR